MIVFEKFVTQVGLVIKDWVYSEGLFWSLYLLQFAYFAQVYQRKHSRLVIIKVAIYYSENVIISRLDKSNLSKGLHILVNSEIRYH